MADVIQGERAPAGPRVSGRRAAPRKATLRLPRIDGLDGLRIVGAMAVLVYHVLGVMLGPNPAAGVILPAAAFSFFVISGLVIYRPYAQAHLTRAPLPPLGRYLAARVVRVLPLWWLAVGTYLVIDGADMLRTPAQWVSTLLIVHYIIPEVRFAVIGPAWALSVEWIFYLIAPLFATAIYQFNRHVARGVAPMRVQMVSLVSLLVVTCVVPPLRPFAGIVLGMMLAVADVHRHLVRRTPMWIRIVRSPITVLAVTTTAWALLVDYPYRSGLSVQWVEQDPTVVVIWATMASVWVTAIAFAVRPGITIGLLSTPLFLAAAQLSFGVYLWHDLILRQVTERMGTDAHLTAAMYLTITGSLALSWVTFTFIERPGIVVRQRLASGRTSPDELSARQATASSEAPTASAERQADGAALATADQRTRRKPRRIAAFDGLLVLAVTSALALQVAAAGSGSPDRLRLVATLAVPLFAVGFTVVGYLRYRPWVDHLDDAAAHPDGRQSPPGGRLLANWFRRALAIYPIYWVVQAVALWSSGTAGVSGLGDWTQLVTAFPFPNPGVLADHGIGRAAWVVVVLIGIDLILPLLGRGLDVTVRSGTGAVKTQTTTLGLLFAGLLIVAATGPVVIGFAACAVGGMGIAILDGWQRAHRRWVPGLRSMVRQPATLIPIVGACWFAGYLAALDTDLDTIFNQHRPIQLMAMVVVSIALVLPAVFGTASRGYRRILGSAPARQLAPLAYGAFLWLHPLTQQTVRRVDLSVPVLGIWVLIAAFTAAFATFHLVQQPLDRPRRRGRSGRSTPSPRQPRSNR